MKKKNYLASFTCPAVLAFKIFFLNRDILKEKKSPVFAFRFQVFEGKRYLSPVFVSLALSYTVKAASALEDIQGSRSEQDNEKIMM